MDLLARALNPMLQKLGDAAWFYFCLIALAVWGGAVSYIQRVHRGEASRFHLAELIGEICTSGFCGVMVGLIAENYNAPRPVEAFMVGIAGHMGSRLIYQLESVFTRYLTRYGVDVKPGE